MYVPIASANWLGAMLRHLSSLVWVTHDEKCVHRKNLLLLISLSMNEATSLNGNCQQESRRVYF